MTRHLKLNQCKVLSGRRLPPTPKQSSTDELLQQVLRQQMVQQQILEKIQQHSPIALEQRCSYGGESYYNNLNVACITSEDDLFEMLEQQLGTAAALHCIKGCALGDVASDCALVQKVYCFPSEVPPMQFTNSRRNNIEYCGANRKKVILGRDAFGNMIS